MMSSETNPEAPSAFDMAAMFQNPALMGMIQKRLDKLVGLPSGYLASLPNAVKQRIRALKNIQSKNVDLEIKFREELSALEKKYLGLAKPLYERRAAIIKGTSDPTDEESILSEELFDEERIKELTDNEAEEATPEQAAIVGIPEFWLSSMKSNPMINDMITPQDEEVLQSLQDIQLSYLPENPGFSLTFLFDKNEYFTNNSLTKTYYLKNSTEHSYDNFIYDHCEGADIEWFEGKNLCVQVVTKTQRKKGTNQTRVIKTEVPTDSFFNFFCPPELPEEEDTSDEAMEVNERLHADYDIGEEFKTKVIPRSVDWFTGEALDYGDFGEDEDEEDDLYEDDESESEEDEEASSDEGSEDDEE